MPNQNSTPSARRMTYESCLGLFFAITGALLATSLFDIGNSGVPLYFLVFCIPLIKPFIPAAWEKGRKQVYARNPLIALYCMFFCLCVITFFHVVLDIQGASMELTHGVARLSFLAYCGVCLIHLRGEVLAACMRWLKRILAILFVYGIYQIPAKLIGLPLFLDWLRNNKSFYMYDYNTAGWISLARATSVYPEPSACIVPVVVATLLNIYLPATRFSKIAVWCIILAFSAVTFSRTIWLSLLAMGCAGIAARFPVVRNTMKGRPAVVFTILIIATILMPLWSMSGSNYGADVSRQERAGSVIVGMHLFMEHPILGAGWNSYEYLMPSYQLGVPDVDPEIQFITIHNMFVSYAEQAGIGGFLFALFPFVLILFAVKAPLEVRLATLFSLLAAAELGGDVAYAALFWLWVASLLNWNPATFGRRVELSSEPKFLHMQHT